MLSLQADKVALAHGWNSAGMGYVGDVPAMIDGIPAFQLEDGPQGVADGVTQARNNKC